MRQLFYILIFLVGGSLFSEAQVELLKQKQVNATSANPSFFISVPISSERLLVLIISNEYLISGDYQILSVEYGGISMSKAGDFASTSLLDKNEINIYYLTDSLLSSALDSSIVVNYNLGNLTDIAEANYTALFFGHVEQLNPIFGFTGDFANNANLIKAQNSIVASSNDGVLAVVNSSDPNVVFNTNQEFSALTQQSNILTSTTVAWQDMTLSGSVNPSASSNMFATRVAIAAFAINNSNGVALPIKLGEWSGKRESNGVMLSWKTLSESNNDFFLIESSFDFEQWVEIGIVNGAGNSRSEEIYQFLDSMIANKSAYYRLT